MRHRAFILSFGFLFFIFLGPLIILKQTFIFGDYGVQHYPWARAAFDAARSGQLPLWTNLMCGGFPFAGEGQAGVFYALNFIFYRFLPFNAAYTLLIPAHMLLGGVGFYMYARALSRTETASAVGALCFAFGSAFAGCFYNTGSLKTLAWMPVGLWILEKARAGGGLHRLLLVSLLSLVISQQWTAGFPQLAVYAFLYYGLSALRSLRALAALTASFVAGTVVASPQIVLSLELIRESVRQGESAAFALWGSVPPAALSAVAFPVWGNLFGAAAYVGIGPLLLVALMPWTRRPAGWVRHALLATFFVLLALGKYNPLYRELIESTGWTAFRNPGKFLFFATFALCVTTCYAYDALTDTLRAGAPAKRLRMAILAAAASIAALPGAVWAAIRVWGPALHESARAVASAVVAEKGAGAKDLSYYLQKAERIIGGLTNAASYADPFTLWSITLAVFAALLAALFAARRLSSRTFARGFMALLVVDLWVFGVFLGTGFIGNARETPPDPSPTQARITSDLMMGDLFAELGVTEGFEIAEPNRNMLYGIAHAGGYTPLLIKRYYELMKDFGFMDASLGREPFEAATWRKQRGLLDAAGVGLIRSEIPLDWADLDEDAGDSAGGLFYRNHRVLPMISGYSHWKVIPDKAERLAFLKSEAFNPQRDVVLESDPGLDEAAPGTLARAFVASWHKSPGGFEADIAPDRACVLLMRVPSYPGWKFEIDGEAARSFTANHAFTGLIAPKGRHLVRAVYKPVFLDAALNAAWVVAGILFAVVLAAAVALRMRRA